jgi:hypothetical protein
MAESDMSVAEALKAARAAGIQVAIDGDAIVLEAEHAPPAQMLDTLRARKPEVLELLQAERRAVVRWIAENFRSSPIGQCALCSDGGREDDPFLLVFVGEDRADLHASCHPIWLAEQEVKAGTVLGIGPPNAQGRGRSIQNKPRDRREAMPAISAGKALGAAEAAE